MLSDVLVGMLCLILGTWACHSIRSLVPITPLPSPSPTAASSTSPTPASAPAAGVGMYRPLTPSAAVARDPLASSWALTFHALSCAALAFGVVVGSIAFVVDLALVFESTLWVFCALLWCV